MSFLTKPPQSLAFQATACGGFGLDGGPVSEGVLLMDVSLIVAERQVLTVARQPPHRIAVEPDGKVVGVVPEARVLPGWPVRRALLGGACP